MLKNSFNIRKFKSFPTLKKRVLANFPKNYLLPKNEDKCWEWQGYTNEKYGQISWGSMHYFAHRLSYIIFNGPLLNEDIIQHTCDNKLCVNPKHLIKGSYCGNMKDRIFRGASPRIKLNIECVKVIRWMLKYKNYVGLASKLARLYHVPEQTISAIKHNKQWKWIEIKL